MTKGDRSLQHIKRFHRVGVELKKQWSLQLMVIPWIIWLVIFCYVPMYGIIIAFKEFRFELGIWGSEWVGLKQFQEFLTNPAFVSIIKNTLGISLYKLLICMPAPLIFALLLNELRYNKYKRVVQTVSYLPHFVSWVILSGIIINFTSLSGPLNNVLMALHIIEEPIMFLGESKYFWHILVISDMWTGIGWGSIIYLAAIGSIDPNLYEAAEIDGAGRFRRMLHVTLPALIPTIIVVMIFSLGGILNSNFDQIYLLRNPHNLDVAEVIDTHVYTSGVAQGRYSYATAVGLFKSVIGFILIMLSNWFAKRISKGEQGII